MPYKLTEPLALTKDGVVVSQTDPDAHTVLGGVGSEISDADARKYGLLTDDPQPEGAKAKAVSAPPENKAVDSPPENKTKGTALPADFPAYDLLKAEGVTTYEQLGEKRNDLTAIKGVGEVLASKIGGAYDEYSKNKSGEGSK